MGHVEELGGGVGKVEHAQGTLAALSLDEGGLQPAQVFPSLEIALGAWTHARQALAEFFGLESVHAAGVEALDLVEKHLPQQGVGIPTAQPQSFLWPIQRSPRAASGRYGVRWKEAYLLLRGRNQYPDPFERQLRLDLLRELVVKAKDFPEQIFGRPQADLKEELGDLLFHRGFEPGPRNEQPMLSL